MLLFHGVLQLLFDPAEESLALSSLLSMPQTAILLLYCFGMTDLDPVMENSRERIPGDQFRHLVLGYNWEGGFLYQHGQMHAFVWCTSPAVQILEEECLCAL